jgi:hypothetical protein
MNFDAVPGRQAVNHQELVEGILERVNGQLGIEVTLEQFNAATSEATVEMSLLVGRAAKISSLKIEGEAAIFRIGAPQAAGLENWRGGRQFKVTGPSGCDFDVAGWIVGRELDKSRLQGQPQIAEGTHTKRNSTDAQGNS